MLAFTPEVEAALSWFDATHELMVSEGRAWWRRTVLPGPGSLGEQNARLMEALDYLRQVHDDLLRPKPKRETTTDG